MSTDTRTTPCFHVTTARGEVYGAGYFVTSERFVTYYPEYRAEPRRFTVRRIETDGSIETVSDFQAYGSRSGAHAAAKRLAAVTS